MVVKEIEAIDVKNFGKIKIPKDIENKYIFISSVTDPYNNYEMKHEKTLKDIKYFLTFF